jgi:hypothetical protein
MINYISIKSALRFIPKPLFSQSTDLDFMSWMLDGYRQLDVPQIYESKVKIVEIVNGSVELPQEIKEINLITYLDKEPTETDIYSLTDCICNTESNANDADTNNPCQYTLAYKQFLDSAYYKNNYSPLLYKGNSSTLLCSNCPNHYAKCQNVFTIDKNNILHTNINSGFLCLDYDTEMKNDSDFLILDLTEIKQFLAYYAIAKHWEERASIKEQSADRMAQDALIKAETYLKKARSIVIMRGINPQNITSAQYDGYQHYLKLPERYVYSR